ncbi:hypothetical protein [Agrococcus sp. DT81.2]|uniref:hypothetical protein n=1 Tax=Agrococcus sp. DT81.2 TaxID=3393414 RepID=UPI003CE4B05B
MAVHRNRRLEDWIELAAAAVERARRSLGDAEVARRTEASVSDEDYETTVRVLRTLGRDLQATSTDFSALDARLRGHAEHAPHVPEAPEDATDAVPPVGADATEADSTSGADASATRLDRGPQATLDDLPPSERGAPMRPAELAKRLARLRNPILPHPRQGRAK